VIERYVYRDAAQDRRDQGYNLQSFDDFSELSRRFPDSAYTADARQRMIFLRNVLAQYEINVAEFYLRNKAYVASANRAQYVIEHYQQAPQTGDALAISHAAICAGSQGIGRPGTPGAGAELSESSLPDRSQVAACAVHAAQDGAVLGHH
jgi:outer membrane assembly lipoprotein YfiO